MICLLEKIASFESPLSELVSRAGAHAVWIGLTVCTGAVCGELSTPKAWGGTVEVRTLSCLQSPCQSLQDHTLLKAPAMPSCAGTMSSQELLGVTLGVPGDRVQECPLT